LLLALACAEVCELIPAYLNADCELRNLPKSKGPAKSKKSKSGDPRGERVRQRPKKEPGRIYFFDKGPAKTKPVTPWWMGGSEQEKGPGSDLFFRYFFYRVFELPSSRNAQKHDKPNSRKN
jgi:hypothetical protein